MRTLSIFSKLLSAALLMCFCTWAQVQAQQTYIIGSSPNAHFQFAQADSLVNALAASHPGQVTLAFEAGNYALTKAFIINSSGFASTDHLTITSVDKNCDSVVFTYGNTIAALQLNNTKNVTFSHITISSTRTSSCHTVGISGPVDNVLFYHCNILAPANATAGACCPIGTATATAASDKGSISARVNRLHFVGNTISGGCRTIWLNGSASNLLTNIRVDSNSFLMGYDQDVNINYCDTLSFLNNYITPRPGINQNHYGVTLANSTVEGICGNFISFHDVTYSAPTGVPFTISNCTPVTGKRFLVANNVIIGKVAIGYKTTIGHVVTISNTLADVLHNSIFNVRLTTNATYSVNCLNLTGANSDIRAIGNMLVTIDPNEFPLRIDASITNYFTDYNNYWSNGGNVARDGSSSYATISALQAVTGGDKYSLSVAPQWVDSSLGLQLADYKPFLIANTGLATDIEGKTRTATTAIGAYAGVSRTLPIDLGLRTVLSPDASAIVGYTYPLRVVIENYGDSAIRSAQIHYILNNTPGKVFAYSGKTLTKGMSDTLTLNSVSLVKGMNSLQVYLSDINGSGRIDSNQLNDTLNVNINVTKEPVDAALTGFIGLDGLTSTGTHPISVILRNVGPQSIDSATLYFAINSTAQPVVRYRPAKPLVQNASDTVLLGNFSIPTGNVSFLAAIRVTLDGNTANDTLRDARYICSSGMSGTYTVGNSANANYSLATIDTLFNRIRRCGNQGDIILAFESGTYNLGTTPVKLNTDFLTNGRLVITSKAKDRDSVVFVYSGSVGAVQLNGTNNVTFSHITIQSTATSGCVTASSAAA